MDTPFELGDPGPMRDQLVAAVLSGAKTATTSLSREYAQDEEPLPQVGQRQVMVDSAGEGVGTVEVVEVRVSRIADVDLQVALDEGEGFETVAQWRDAHERYWKQWVSWSIDDDTEVVIERFRLL